MAAKKSKTTRDQRDLVRARAASVVKTDKNGRVPWQSVSTVDASDEAERIVRKLHKKIIDGDGPQSFEPRKEDI